MDKYIFLFRGGDSAVMLPNADPKAVQANMMKWKTWMDGMAAQGKLLGGDPLEIVGGKVVNGRAAKVTDGPFAEGKEIIGGYLIVQAKGLDEAVEMSKGCPVLENEGTVEVRRVQNMNM